MTIKAIIVTYNPAQWLDKCLGSLNKSNVKLDVIVIDNGSTDGSIEIIKNDYPNVRLIINSENKGFGAANNQGLSIALNERADYAFLLNQDAWIEPNTIEKLIEVSQNNKGFGVLSPIHLNGKGDALDQNFSNYAGQENSSYFSDLAINKKPKHIYEVPFINAAAWLVTKECLHNIGGFNPSFFHYGEDSNYCERVKYHKLKIGFVPSALIYHDREERLSNPYFDNFKKNYSKTLVLLASAPADKNSKSVFIIIIKDIIKQLLKLNFKHATSIILLAIKIDFHEIKKNKKRSQSKQANFINYLNP